MTALGINTGEYETTVGSGVITDGVGSIGLAFELESHADQSARLGQITEQYRNGGLAPQDIDVLTRTIHNSYPRSGQPLPPAPSKS